jgi:hypothetical protein
MLASKELRPVRPPPREKKKKLSVYDPALCCSTGVCGPAVDPELARVAADLAWLADQGVAVERYNLSQQPAAFALNSLVRGALERGNQVLPLVVADGRIVAEGHYPSRETLAALCGLVLRPAATQPTPTNACRPQASGGSCC